MVANEGLAGMSTTLELNLSQVLASSARATDLFFRLSYNVEASAVLTVWSVLEWLQHYFDRWQLPIKDVN